MKSDNTSKSKNLRIWREITKLSAKRERTHTCTLWINYTAAIERVTSNMQPNRKTVPQMAADKVRGTKTRQSALSKRIWAAVCLLWERFFNSSMQGTDVIHQRWQMWHDSSAWEAAVTTDKTTYSTVCDKGKFVKTKPDVHIHWFRCVRHRKSLKKGLQA